MNKEALMETFDRIENAERIPMRVLRGTMVLGGVMSVAGGSPVLGIAMIGLGVGGEISQRMVDKKKLPKSIQK